MYIGPWQEYNLARNKDFALHQFQRELERRLDERVQDEEELKRLREVIGPLLAPNPVDAVVRLRSSSSSTRRSYSSQQHTPSTSRSIASQRSNPISTSEQESHSTSSPQDTSRTDLTLQSISTNASNGTASSASSCGKKAAATTATTTAAQAKTSTIPSLPRGRLAVLKSKNKLRPNNHKKPGSHLKNEDPATAAKERLAKLRAMYKEHFVSADIDPNCPSETSNQKVQPPEVNSRSGSTTLSSSEVLPPVVTPRRSLEAYLQSYWSGSNNNSLPDNVPYDLSPKPVQPSGLDLPLSNSASSSMAASRVPSCLSNQDDSDDKELEEIKNWTSSVLDDLDKELDF